MPLWFPQFALVLLLIGLSIVLATAFVQKGIGPTPSDERSEEASGVSATAEAAVDDALRGDARFAAWVQRIKTDIEAQRLHVERDETGAGFC